VDAGVFSIFVGVLASVGPAGSVVFLQKVRCSAVHPHPRYFNTKKSYKIQGPKAIYSNGVAA
jgi:hypothetical protein